MEIRHYKEGDELQILELFKLSFNKEMTLDYWKWRFQDNPFTKDVMIHLMWDGDKMVGHYAVCPVEMVIDNQVVMTAFSMTTMTHPDYNGRGIFTQLSSSLYNELTQKYGYAMVWGFPNNNSHYAFVKNLKWDNIATIPMLGIATGRLKKSESESYSATATFTQDIANKLSITDNKVAIHKTAGYLNWRYNQNPFAQYKTLKCNGGIIVYKIIPSFKDNSKYEADIMELYFNNDATVLASLLNSVLFNEDGKDVIQLNMWRSLFDNEYLMLEKTGFTPQAPVTYFGCLNLASDSKTPHDYRNWDINFGYSDVF